MKKDKEQTDVLVTIICIVFNHGKYLKETIEGFLMQKCNFKFNVYIQDDCSTDNSREIIKEYERRYPKIIKGFYLDTNIYSQGISPLFNLLEKVDSDYVAICEGDDYWIDEYKLQKQINFLQSNSDYIATYHNVLVVDDDSKVYKETNEIMPLYVSHDFTIENIEKNLLCCSQTASLVFKNFWKEWDKRRKKIFLECQANGDIKLNVVLLLLGKIYFLEDIMSCYRKSYSNESYTAKNYQKNLCLYFIISRKSIEKMILEMFNKKIHFHLEKYVKNSIVFFMKKPNFENFNIMIKCIKSIGAFNCLISMVKMIIRKIMKTNEQQYWKQLDTSMIKEL